jgi:RNA polymerase sigma factor (sigma-70 family)
MANKPLNGVLQHIRKMAAVQTYRELSDCDLLERFVGARDESAFTVLIERHGPMVLGVCRRALPSFHDAEDACQATFLVLARKATSVRKKTSLGSWLHGVACRVAAKLKRDHARRRTRERRADAPAPRDPAAEVSWREVQAILDEELQRLPERYRAPVILCYLECMTRDEAAKQLGLTPTTLYGRLERARDLLRTCLSQRGLTLAAAISATALGQSVAQAALAPSFVVSSTKAAMLLAAGQPLTDGVVATHVLALTQEVIKTMFLTKLKLGTAAVLCAGLFVTLVGGSFGSLGIAQEAKQEAKEANELLQTRKAESDADFIRRISKDLRGIDPTPTEIHFFVASKDAGKRQKLMDLFIQERQAKKAAAEPGKADLLFLRYKAEADLPFRYKKPIAQAGDDALVKKVPAGRGALPSGVPDWFQKLDADKDGQISLYEWCSAGKSVEEFRHWDLNDDGFITPDEAVAVAGELKKMAGRWRVVKEADNGLQIQWSMVEDSLQIRVGGANIDAKFKVNPAKKPKEIDIITLMADGSDRVIPGIYKLDGDTLEICVDDSGKKRPTEFKAKGAYKMKREKKKDK